MEKDEVIEHYKKLLDDVHFEKLEIGLQVPNIFQILGISRTEIRHSNFLGWLLNPNNSHGLGNNFLIRFLRDLVILQPNNLNNKNKFGIFDINALNFNNVEIRREWRNIDLLIIFDNLVICIENKVDSKDHSNQLKRYREIVQQNFPQERFRHLFVYLTPTGLEPTSKESIGYYTIYSYEKIINHLNQILEIRGDSLNIKILHYILDYVKTLELEIMNNNELNELADKIYQSHKDLIDFIIENKSDTATRMYPFFEKCIQEFGWIIGSKNKGYARFLTPKLKDIIPSNGNGWNQKESFLFEIDFYWNKSGLVFKTVISPNQSDVHQILKKALEGVDGHKKPKGNQWLVHFIEKESFDIEKLILENDSIIIEKINKILKKIKDIVDKVEESILEHEEELKTFIENNNV